MFTHTFMHTRSQSYVHTCVHICPQVLAHRLTVTPLYTHVLTLATHSHTHAHAHSHHTHTLTHQEQLDTKMPLVHQESLVNSGRRSSHSGPLMSDVTTICCVTMSCLLSQTPDLLKHNLHCHNLGTCISTSLTCNKPDSQGTFWTKGSRGDGV